MSASPEEPPPTGVGAAGRLARGAAPLVGALPTTTKNSALEELADTLLDEGEALLAANERDIQAAERRRLPDTVLDQITLTRPRLGAIAESVRAVAALEDPVGDVLRGFRRPNGLLVQEVRVPIGVVGVIYEGRPHTTLESISLCLKAGNAVVLLAGSLAEESNRLIQELVGRAAGRFGIPPDAAQVVQSDCPDEAAAMMRLTECIDMLIVRGEAELIREVRTNATVPVILTGPGNCHTFVERTARIDMAADIAFNAKCQRPGAGNAMETLLVDAPIAGELLPIVGPRMQAAGVELRGCERTRAVLPSVRAATEEDWATAYQDLVLAVRVVDGMEEAIRHIARYGTDHSEAIVTQDYAAARRFTERVDAAAVYVNASTRFTDGFELGLGAELGISTQKLHRRGPIGLRALTTWKWVIQGEGQVRG